MELESAAVPIKLTANDLESRREEVAARAEHHSSLASREVFTGERVLSHQSAAPSNQSLASHHAARQ